MDKKNMNFDNFELDCKIRSLPKITSSQASKDRILNNVLASKKKTRKKIIRNGIEILRPFAFAAAVIFMLIFVNSNFDFVPLNSSNGFYLIVETNVEGATVEVDGEYLGEAPLTDKITSSGEITITKDGFSQWTGKFTGNSIDSALDSFISQGRYEIYRGNNTIKIIVELESIHKDYINIETFEPGATVLVNGKYTAVTPARIKLDARDNFIEVIHDNKEKVSFNVVNDGETITSSDKEVELTDKGYFVNIELEDLYYPLDGFWIDDEQYLLLESNGEAYRGKVINIKSGVVNIAEREFLDSHITKDEEGFIFQNTVYNNTDPKRSFISSKGRVYVEEGRVILEDKVATTIIDNIGDGEIIRMIGETIYYQADGEIYSYNLETGLNTNLTNKLNAEGIVEHIEISSAGIFLLQNGKFIYANDSVERKLKDINNISFITISNDNQMLVFELDKYVKIWKYDLEKESIRKIY